MMIMKTMPEEMLDSLHEIPEYLEMWEDAIRLDPEITESEFASNYILIKSLFAEKEDENELLS